MIWSLVLGASLDLGAWSLELFIGMPGYSGLRKRNHRSQKLDHDSSSRRRHGVTAIGFRFGGRLHAVVAVLGLGGIIEIRLIHLLPRDFFARIAGELAHNRYHRAPGHVVAAVNRLA